MQIHLLYLPHANKNKNDSKHKICQYKVMAYYWDVQNNRVNKITEIYVSRSSAVKSNFT